MKKVLSISLGSSSRDKKVKTTILNDDFIIERKGTDGDKKKAAKLFKNLDGKYDAFGLGGMDLYIFANGQRYTFRDAKKIIKNVSKTPVVDGSGLKNTLERKTLFYLQNENNMIFADRNVLLVSALDRFGMAETLVNMGADVFFGDLIFGLNLPILMKRMKSLELLVKIAAPLVTRLPFDLFYPTGDKQLETSTKQSFSRYYHQADIIAGDIHFIKKHLPENLEGKYIITNSVTETDIKKLKECNIAN